MTKEKSDRERLIDELEAPPKYSEMTEMQRRIADAKLIAMAQSDHWTMPEDPETKAGWGIFNFNWLMKPFREAVLWHDKVTTKGSTAQKIQIPNWRIAQGWRDMLEELSRTHKGAGFIKRTAWAAGFFVAKVNRYFYEGPLGKEPKVKQDPDNGEMF